MKTDVGVRTASIMATIAVVASALVACVPAAPSPTPIVAQVSGNGAQPTIAAPELTKEAIEELAGIGQVTDLVMGVPVEIALSGEIPQDGVTLTRTYAEPLPAEATATFIYWDASLGSWVAAPSELSADRRTVTTVVHHLSWWNDLVGGTKDAIESFVRGAESVGGTVGQVGAFLGGAADEVNASISSLIADGAEALHYTLGDLLTTRVELPECLQSTPDWVLETSVKFEPNDPVLFCVGHDANDSNLLVVKARANRGYGFPVVLEVTSRWAYNSTYEGGLDDALETVGSLDAVVGESITDLFSDGIFVGSGEEVSFGIEASALRDFNAEYLIELPAPSIAQFVASTMASALVAWGTDQVLGYLAAVLAVANCWSHVREIDDVVSGARATANYLSEIDTQVAQQLAVGLLRTGLSEKAAGQLAGRLIGRASIALALLPVLVNSFDYAGERTLPAEARALRISYKLPAAWSIDAGGVGPIRLGAPGDEASGYLSNTSINYACLVGEGPDGETFNLFTGDGSGPIGGIVVGVYGDAAESAIHFDGYDVTLGGPASQLQNLPGIVIEFENSSNRSFYRATIDGTEYGFSTVDNRLYEIQVGWAWAYWECV